VAPSIVHKLCSAIYWWIHYWIPFQNNFYSKCFKSIFILSTI